MLELDAAIKASGCECSSTEIKRKTVDFLNLPFLLW